MKIVFATNNRHKLEEIKPIVEPFFTIAGLSDIGCFDEIPEDQNTLEGNAFQKAMYINKKYNVGCFADDTGMEIEALKGAPGVFSARYSGLSGSAEEKSEANIDKVLNEMKNVQNRNAQFRTIICFITNGKDHFFEGVIKGEILRERHGNKGFGYDSIFLPANYILTFAEMSIEEKRKISHRTLAINKFIAYLLSNKNTLA